MTGKRDQGSPVTPDGIMGGSGNRATSEAQNVWNTHFIDSPDLGGVGELPPTRKTASPRKRRIPRKPSPAQIERFEALRARVMGISERR